MFRDFVTILLNLVVVKPIAIFVWWLSACSNYTAFHSRAELVSLVKQARREGAAILFVSNHLSMFDDPILPMALYRTGLQASVEFLGLTVLLILGRVVPATIIEPGLFACVIFAFLIGIGLWGARKTWWSLGDLANFSGTSALRNKIEFSRRKPLSMPLRIMLRAGNPVIYYFMRSDVVKTVFVDRGPGEEARRSRLRTVERTIELLACGQPVWIFFEGGRSRIPDEIRSARPGLGRIVLGLEARGIRPVVIAIHHRGLEHVMPINSRRWLTSGHRIDIRWSEYVQSGGTIESMGAQDCQKIADLIRTRVVRLQSNWRSEASTDG